MTQENGHGSVDEAIRPRILGHGSVDEAIRPRILLFYDYA